MSLTWTDLQTKAVRLSRDISPGTLTQLQQDMNTGYAMFNAKLARYWSRKQQFTDITAGQGIYQTPIDCVRIIGMTVAVSNTWTQPVKEIRSEFEWRQITAYPYSSNWPAYYFMIGNDELAVWPTPSQDVENGLRFYYEPQTPDLSVADIISSTLIPVQTITVTNGNTLVTSTGSTFTNQLVGLNIQFTGVTDLSWYEIVAAPTASTLTLKSAFVGNSGSTISFRIGQLPIIPPEYHSNLTDYALWLFFSGKGNESRALQHKNLYDAAIEDAIAAYSSSTEGNVISDDGSYLNSWFVTPIPPTS